MVRYFTDAQLAAQYECRTAAHPARPATTMGERSNLTHRRCALVAGRRADGDHRAHPGHSGRRCRSPRARTPTLDGAADARRSLPGRAHAHLPQPGGPRRAITRMRQAVLDFQLRLHFLPYDQEVHGDVHCAMQVLNVCLLSLEELGRADEAAARVMRGAQATLLQCVNLKGRWRRSSPSLSTSVCSAPSRPSSRCPPTSRARLAAHASDRRRRRLGGRIWNSA